MMTFRRGDMLTLRDGSRAVVKSHRPDGRIVTTVDGLFRIVTTREVVGKYGNEEAV